MDFSLVCRTCLSGDQLNPIFNKNNDTDMYTNVIYGATGVQVGFNDKLPQNMCSDCINTLNSILKFRKLCKDTETKLLNFVTEEKTLTVQNIANKSIISKKQLKAKIKNNSISDPTKKFEINNEYLETDTDLDDDKPLKLLLNSKAITTRIKSECTKDKSTLNDSDNNIETSNVDIPDYEIKDELTSNLIEMHNTSDNNISDDETEQNQSTTLLTTKTTRKAPKAELSNGQLSYNNDSSPVNTMELPYELITDPTSEKAMRVLCKLCNKELSIRSIDSHMTRRHPGADERKVKCDLCDSYVLKEKLNRHKVMIHGTGGFRCGYCKSEYDTKQQLLDHVETCAGKKRKRKVNESSRELSECDVCHKVMQKASLKMHKAVKHAGLRPVCEHCGKSFGNKFRLNEHYRAKHGYEKFQCSYCEFRSAGVMAMRNHERRHRGEKPFVCEECGAKFHAAYLLAQHKHSHRTEKLVKCDICPATFKANNSLHMHKLTCHSSAMYRCTVCCRSYKCRHYAVKHARHVHRYTGNTPPLTVVEQNITQI